MLCSVHSSTIIHVHLSRTHILLHVESHTYPSTRRVPYIFQYICSPLHYTYSPTYNTRGMSILVIHTLCMYICMYHTLQSICTLFHILVSETLEPLTQCLCKHHNTNVLLVIQVNVREAGLGTTLEHNVAFFSVGDECPPQLLTIVG